MAASLNGIFEKTLQDKIKNVKLLLIGVGGIGCEVLKNLVLCGFPHIEIIDLDTIELSNLNRQLLFQRKHIGKSKAHVARESALQYNPDVEIIAHHANIMSTEYNVNYFQKFDVIICAVDNVTARKHVNRMCLNADVPLIESGSSGYLGQVEVYKKNITACFECVSKDEEKTIPSCTIRNTPTMPIHCIVWAKHLFNQLFGEIDEAEDISPSEIEAVAAVAENNASTSHIKADTSENPEAAAADKIDEVEDISPGKIEAAAVAETKASNCHIEADTSKHHEAAAADEIDENEDISPGKIEAAAVAETKAFTSHIEAVGAAAADEIDENEDISPGEIEAVAAEAEINESTSHIEAAEAAAADESVSKTTKPINLRQWAYDTNYDAEKLFDKLFYDDVNDLLSMSHLWQTRKPPVPMQWKSLNLAELDLASDDVNVAASAEYMKQYHKIWTQSECATIFAKCLKSLSCDFRNLNDINNSLTWNKDNSTAMDFVAACANLRAYVFAIETKSRFDIKTIAANIMPAIAATNAVVAGLCVMRVFDVLCHHLDQFKGVNLCNARNEFERIIIPDNNVMKPDPNCTVCSEEPLIKLRVDTKRLRLKEFKDKVVIEKMNFMMPDIINITDATVIISSVEGETESNEEKFLNDLNIVDGVLLQVDDLFQNYLLRIKIEHFDAKSDEALFEVIADKTNDSSPSLQSDDDENENKQSKRQNLDVKLDDNIATVQASESPKQAQNKKYKISRKRKAAAAATKDGTVHAKRIHFEEDGPSTSKGIRAKNTFVKAKRQKSGSDAKRTTSKRDVSAQPFLNAECQKLDVQQDDDIATGELKSPYRISLKRKAAAGEPDDKTQISKKIHLIDMTECETTEALELSKETETQMSDADQNHSYKANAESTKQDEISKKSVSPKKAEVSRPAEIQKSDVKQDGIIAADEQNFNIAKTPEASNCNESSKSGLKRDDCQTSKQDGIIATDEENFGIASKSSKQDENKNAGNETKKTEVKQNDITAADQKNCNLAKTSESPKQNKNKKSGVKRDSTAVAAKDDVDEPCSKKQRLSDEEDTLR